MAVARKILMNTGAMMLGKAIMAAMGFVTLKLITGYLGLEQYGYYTAVYDFIALFGIASDLGLYTIAVREISRDEKNTEKIIGNILTMRLILVGVVMLLAFGTSFFYFSRYQGQTDIMLPLAAAITAGATIFALLTGTISALLQVHYKMQYNALASVVGKFFALSYLIYIILIWKPDVTGQGFYHLFAAGIVGNLAMFAITFYHARKIARIVPRFDWSFMGEVIRKSFLYGIALILNNLYFRMGSFMLLPLAGPEQTGLYGVPLRVVEAIAILPLYFVNAVLPTLTAKVKEKNQEYKKIIQYSFDALVMAGIPMAIGMYTIAYPVIGLLSKEEYLSRLSEGFYGSDIVLQIMIFALAFSFINTLFGVVLVVVNKQSKLLYVNGAGAFVAIASNFLLIPWIGARGAAVTDIVVEFAVALFAYLLAKKYLDFSIKITNSLKIIIAGLIMGGVVMLLKEPLYNLCWPLSGGGGGAALEPAVSAGRVAAGIVSDVAAAPAIQPGAPVCLENVSILPLIIIAAIVYTGLMFAMRVVTKDMLKSLWRR